MTSNSGTTNGLWPKKARRF